MSWTIVLTMSRYHQDAVTAALAGDWHRAHNLVQQHDYAYFADPRAELAEIKQVAEAA